MINIEAQLYELDEIGVTVRDRLISGPQGPHVVVDGRPVLMLGSDNYLGLADHPRVRQAAATAAMRWGVGAGVSRTLAGMTPHRRLEERLADFTGRDRICLFGSHWLAAAGVIPALARPGDVVFCDAGNHPSLMSACRLSGAEVFLYEHLDVEHLAWGIDRCEGRGSLIVTESLFWGDGELAALDDLAELAHAYGLRLLADEAEAIGTVGPEGRGLSGHSDAGADVVVGTLGGALGSHGGFVACDALMAEYLQAATQTLTCAPAPPPPALAGALAALELLQERPELVRRVAANAAALRRELQREGFHPGNGPGPAVMLRIEPPDLLTRVIQRALSEGVLAGMSAPADPRGPAALRLSAMASHRPDEVRLGARVVAGVLRQIAPQDAGAPAEIFDLPAVTDPYAEGAAFDLEADGAADRPEFAAGGVSAAIFDLEADERLAA